MSGVRPSLTGMSNTSRVTSKGQVTIPQQLRIEYAFHPGVLVRFHVVDGRVVLDHADEPDLNRGRRLVARMRGRASRSRSTEELLALTRSRADAPVPVEGAR